MKYGREIEPCFLVGEKPFHEVPYQSWVNGDGAIGQNPVKSRNLLIPQEAETHVAASARRGVTGARGTLRFILRTAPFAAPLHATSARTLIDGIVGANIAVAGY